MAISKWFDYNHYMTSKLAQVNKVNPAAKMDMSGLVAAFQAAGFVGAEGAEKHFLTYGQFEDLGPNAFFNPTEYLRAKAASAYTKDPKAVTDLDVANVKQAFANAGFSPWNHYKMYGTTEGVNPSNEFNSDAYMQAKVDALNSIKDGKQYTVTELKAEFQKMGLSALEHFMTYGGGTGEPAGLTADGKIPAAFAVPEDKKVNAGGEAEGNTYVLTREIDNIVGSAGNDIFLGDNNTATAGDQIDGGAGFDTLKLYSPAAANVPTMKSIEKVFISGATASISLAGNTGLSELQIDSAAGSHTYTVAAAAPVKTVTVSNSTSAISDVVAGLSASAVALNLDAAGTRVGTPAVYNIDLQGVSLDTVNVTSKNSTSETAGNNILLRNTTGAVKNVTVAGDKALTLDLTSETSVTSLVSSMTAGGVTANVQGLTLATVTGAAGDDTFLFGSTAVGNAVINGGEGVDAVGINAANTAALFNSNKIVNVETIRVQDAFVVNTGTTGYGNAFDLSKVAGAKNVTFDLALTTDSSAAAKILTISNMASEGTLTFGANYTATTATSGLLVNIKDAGLNSNDVLNVALTGSGSHVINGFTAQGVETLNIDSKNGGTTDFGGVVDAQLTSIKLTSSLANNATAGTFTLNGTGTAFSSTIINTVDASGYNGAVTMTALANNLVASGATIKGGGGVLTATGTTGVDTVIAGSGGIEYTLAGGADSINLQASTAKSDEIVAGASTSASTAFAKVTGFVAAATNADELNLVTTTTGTDVTTATATGIANVTYTMSKGFITFGGSGLSTASVSSLIDAVLSTNIAASTTNNFAFTAKGNTYVINADGTAGTNAADVVIELVGVTNATALGTAAAENTIFIS